MECAGSDDHRRGVGEFATRVDITVIPGPRGPTLAQRAGSVRKRSGVGWVVAATLAAGALVAGVSLTRHGGATSRLPTTVLPNTVLYPTYLRTTGRFDVRPASAYPLRCLSLPIALHDPRFINEAFDRNVPCGHPHGPYTLIAVRAP